MQHVRVNLIPPLVDLDAIASRVGAKADGLLYFHKVGEDEQ